VHDTSYDTSTMASLSVKHKFGTLNFGRPRAIEHLAHVCDPGLAVWQLSPSLGMLHIGIFGSADAQNYCLVAHTKLHVVTMDKRR
jgi:hypothetical protein